MSSPSPVRFQRRSYRGVIQYVLSWEEAGAARENAFATEAEAVVAMTEIEERLRTGVAAGQGLTVNPFGLEVPFVTSKDVQFAALRLQPRGLGFRDAILGYVGAHGLLQGTGASVVEAARAYAEAEHALKPHDVSLAQAVFEWVELKKAAAGRPLFELLRATKAAEPAKAGGSTESVGG